MAHQQIHPEQLNDPDLYKIDYDHLEEDNG